MDKTTKAELAFEKTNEEARKFSEDQASKEYDLTKDFDSWVATQWTIKLQTELHLFPKYCELARVQNLEELKKLEESGHKSSYTGSTGWSEKGDFKFSYVIHSKLYILMRNLIKYSGYEFDFWSDENAKVHKKFMKKIVNGDPPWMIFKWVCSNYGIDPELKISRLANKLKNKKSLAAKGVGGVILGKDGNPVGQNNQGTIITKDIA